MPETLQTIWMWLGPPWSIWTASILVAIGAVGLAWGASWTVDSAVVIASRLGVSTHVVGLTLVALGTSAPEFAVSITAASDGNSEIAISNVIGSNIFNLGFILGGVALIRPIVTDRTSVFRDATVLLIASVSVWILFGIDLGVDRSNGAMLLLGLAAYLALIMLGSKGSPFEEEITPDAGTGTWASLGRLVLGIVIIATAAELLVEAASSIASAFGVSQWVIGMTIVAAGTSLPEFTTSLVAALRGHHGLSLGNIIGSDIQNVLGVLGLTAVIHPVTIPPDASGALLALVGMVLLVTVFMRTGWRLSRWEGALLVLAGVVRWILDFT